ncbi:MAG: FdhF/YdeP family oxidoreductase [Candidatus Nanopelagicales bacterium]|nr:FdhF/YdeP family oxidoreductase [Candidatus Nanopelagicales bacterium]MDZ4249675.1 FdhF/YdeP family oxidoreductase [Candidatus Nanopelagicales bacterium]
MVESSAAPVHGRSVAGGGGLPAILYSLKAARASGGYRQMWRALRSKNTCKTCALGMGGQEGGMVNEVGHFPEVCKKAFQAQAGDMRTSIPDSFWPATSVSKMRQYSPLQMQALGRLTTPVFLPEGSDHYESVGWDDALGLIADELGGTAPDETFWYASGRASNEAGFLIQLLARCYGTNNVSNCSSYCHQASGVGMTGMLGTATATVELDDVEHADLVFVIGGNPASNHPRLMNTLKRVRRREGHVVVINPIVESGLVRFRVPSDPASLLTGTRIASEYVQPNIGGDLALLTGIAKRVVEIGGHDQEFLAAHCDGWPELMSHLADQDWPTLEAASGVTRARMDTIAGRYADAKNVVFCWTMGITHHANGVANVEAIANLALLRGMVGRRHAGLLPLRGQSNVQGVGSMGVSSRLNDAAARALTNKYGLTLPTEPGWDTIASIRAAHDGKAKVGVCLGGNLYGASPDARWAAEALGKLSLLVHVSTSMNTGHVRGTGQRTVILPALPRDEEPDKTTQESMFSFVRLSDGGPARHSGPRSEVVILSQLAQLMPALATGVGGALDWAALRHPGGVRELIADVVPGYAPISGIDGEGGEFAVPGRVRHEPKFATRSGRAILKTYNIPDASCGPDEMRLMTIRSEGQFNTVVFEDHDLYRGIGRRDVLLIHPDDLARLGISDEAAINVRSSVGQMAVLAAAFDGIRPGNVAMYYPEANSLVPDDVDPRSGTPAFKSVPVRVWLA